MAERGHQSLVSLRVTASSTAGDRICQRGSEIMGAPNHDTNYAWRVALPWNGRVGEFVVLTPSGETVFDSEDPGQASIWVCVRASEVARNLKAVWARVELDDVAQPAPRSARVGSSLDARRART
jgi:hypothetical protein